MHNALAQMPLQRIMSCSSCSSGIKRSRIEYAFLQVCGYLHTVEQGSI